MLQRLIFSAVIYISTVRNLRSFRIVVFGIGLNHLKAVRLVDRARGQCFTTRKSDVPSRKKYQTHHLPSCATTFWHQYIYIYGCFLQWWYPQNTPKWSFLVGKHGCWVPPFQETPISFQKPPYSLFEVSPFLWRNLVRISGALSLSIHSGLWWYNNKKLLIILSGWLQVSFLLETTTSVVRKT